MPVDYWIDSQLRVVFIDAHGYVTAEDLQRASLEMTLDADYEPDLDYLADARGADLRDVTAAGLQKLVTLNLSLSDRVAPSRLAYVVDSDLAFGLGRMLATLSEESQVAHRVFRDMAEAREWLGLPRQTDPV